MEFISKCTADTISKAAQSLKDGHLVAFPTETVYGLGADATNEKAVSRIYSVKGRPVGHPLIVHISSINKLDNWATDIPDYAIKLAREFWPGPMTLILPRTDIAKDFITGGQNNVGLRVPAQPIALALLKKFEDLGGQGVAAPSANRFGAVSPTLATDVTEEISHYLEKNDLILDGGPCSVGIESTIINCSFSGPSILRPGAITKKMIEQVSNVQVININKEFPIKVSGNLKSHYSPKAQVQIEGQTNFGDGFIALSEIETPSGAIRLISPNTIEDFAKQLYFGFRRADALNIKKIVVVLPIEKGIGVAISDRITKSAFKKII
jgi:L-threonylcarbamoyladenylate synthase